MKNVVQPDIPVICDTENIDVKDRYYGTPTLIVEVLSDTTQNKDMLKKLDLYLHSGIKEYWIVSPSKKEVYIYLFHDSAIKNYSVYKSNETAHSNAFEGLAVPLSNIFPD